MSGQIQNARATLIASRQRAILRYLLPLISMIISLVSKVIRHLSASSFFTLSVRVVAISIVGPVTTHSYVPSRSTFLEHNHVMYLTIYSVIPRPVACAFLQIAFSLYRYTCTSEHYTQYCLVQVILKETFDRMLLSSLLLANLCLS